MSKINNKGSARLFRSSLLEFFTRAHPALIFSIYLPIIFYLPYYSKIHFRFTGIKLVGLIFSGLMLWSLTEYLLHRFVFHYEPSTDLGKRISYLFHGNHHEFPRDKDRLFMPPVPSLIIASLFLVSFYFVVEKNALPLFSGFMSGYLIYGSMHYAIHAGKPPFRWMKGLWRNHELHHYKHADKGFGVTSTLWDHVFCTMYDGKQNNNEVTINSAD